MCILKHRGKEEIVHMKKRKLLFGVIALIMLTSCNYSGDRTAQVEQNDNYDVESDENHITPEWNGMGYVTIRSVKI